MAILDLQTIRYINLLDNASKVKTSKCFVYNNIIIFAVPKFLVSKAIGQDASNVKYIQQKLGKKVKIIRESEGIGEVERFVRDVVAPISFKSLELKEGVLVLTAGSQSKAALIGRNRRREEELRQILQDTFNLDMKIV